ncbi:hypothetical protein F050043D4_13460 [Bacteroides thetaiotaomicron]
MVKMAVVEMKEEETRKPRIRLYNLKSLKRKEEKSMKKTWSVVLKVIIAVAGAIAGVLGVQAASL